MKNCAMIKYVIERFGYRGYYDYIGRPNLIQSGYRSVFSPDNHLQLQHHVPREFQPVPAVPVAHDDTVLPAPTLDISDDIPNDVKQIYPVPEPVFSLKALSPEESIPFHENHIEARVEPAVASIPDKMPDVFNLEPAASLAVPVFNKAPATVEQIPAIPVPAVKKPIVPAPSSSSSQFHAQDEEGNHEYGYTNVNSAKHEVGLGGHSVRGSYSWVDEAGYHSVHYVADDDGFRIIQ